MCNTNNPDRFPKDTKRLEVLMNRRKRMKEESAKQKRKRNSPQNFNGMIQFVEYFDSEEMCLAYFEAIRWKDGKFCPHCGLFNVWELEDKHNYRCADCNKVFNVKTKTIFEGSKVNLRSWFMCIYLENAFIGGITSGELERQLPHCRQTGGGMLRKIREYGYNQKCFDTYIPTGSNPIYALDTMARDGEERNRQDYRKQSYRGGTDKQFVLVVAQRGGHARGYVIDDVQEQTMTPIIKQHIPDGANVHTDQAPTFNGLSEWYKHETVNHKQKEFGRDGVSTNVIEGWNSYFQTGLGKFRNSIPLIYTNLFVNAAIFRYNTRYMNESEKLDLVLQNICINVVDKTLPRLCFKRTTYLERERLRTLRQKEQRGIMQQREFERAAIRKANKELKEAKKKRKLEREQRKADKAAKKTAREQKKADIITAREQKKAAREQKKADLETVRQQKKAAREQRKADKETIKQQAREQRKAVREQKKQFNEAVKIALKQKAGKAGSTKKINNTNKASKAGSTKKINKVFKAGKAGRANKTIKTRLNNPKRTTRTTQTTRKK